MSPMVEFETRHGGYRSHRSPPETSTNNRELLTA
jgi:hypothetical protein